MNKILVLFFAVLAFATSAQAAVIYDGYPTGPGGLSTPYPAPPSTPEVYAGLIEMQYDGSPLLVMFDDYNARTPVGASGQATIYTYADVQNGAPVKFTSAQYARVGYLLWSTSVSGVNGTLLNSPSNIRLVTQSFGSYALDWFAGLNTVVWNTMNPGIVSLPSPDPLNLFNDISSAQDWMAALNSGAYDAFDWSQTMYVSKFTDANGNTDEGLIPLAGQNFTIASAPLPPAIWLLGSGLLGLIGIARRKKAVVH